MLRNSILGLLVMISLGGWAQTRGGARFPIRASQVAQVLSRAGMEVTERQVHLGATVWSATQTPSLEVLGTEGLAAGGRVWIEIGCEDRHQCQPFYVSVLWKGPVPLAGKQAHVEGPGHSASYAPPVIRLGDHATLVVDSPGLHMEIAVIALQNGTVGQVIRLATPDRRQFYQGQVVNKVTLKGSL